MDLSIPQLKTAVGRTILSSRQTKRTAKPSLNYTAMIGEMILNNAHAPTTECFIYSF